MLSLFDGMSCGQIALKELNIKFDKYYSSEIDKFAIKQTQHNFPNTIQLGDITKWREWDVNWNKCFLILAGSPCQGFSFAGKHLNFNDERSKLFFVFIDILNHVEKLNPNVLFLFENVNMKKEYLRVISECIGVCPVNINSSLVSAQIRTRWYWTNIKTKIIKGMLFTNTISYIPKPVDKKILLKDVLENGSVDRLKSCCLTANYKNSSYSEYRKRKHNQVVLIDKCGAITTDGMLAATKRKRDVDGKSLTTHLSKKKVRKLTVMEASRLQTIPDWYEWVVSDTQAYKMLGNGWTIEIIKHILKLIDDRLLH